MNMTKQICVTNWDVNCDKFGSMASPCPLYNPRLWKIAKFQNKAFPYIGLFLSNTQNDYHWIYVLWMGNLCKLVTNDLLSHKSLKIQDSCLLRPLIPRIKIVRVTFLAISKSLVWLQTWQNKLILALIYIFITTQSISSINLMTHGLTQTIIKMSSVKKAKNDIWIFRKSTSIHNRFVIYTSKCILENDTNMF